MVIHVHGAQPGTLTAGLRTARNAHTALPDTPIELVVQGAAVAELSATTELATAVTAANSDHGIKVLACANSLRAVGIAAENLTAGVTTVPAAVTHLAQRQWADGLMSVSERTRPAALAALTTWRARQWAVTAAAALGCVVLIGVPTDLIETPLFSRAVPPTWWSYPVLAVSSLLAGLLVATYVNGPTGPGPRNDGRWGSFGGALTFFAVGCPVCNKVVLFALGTSGALQYFGPLQPLLALGSVALLAWALRQRLLTTNSCPLPPQPAG